MKPYQYLPIFESGEPLVAIPPGLFYFESPHPYARLGAPYAQASPFWLRRGVLNSLVQAQNALQKEYPNWQILIFDAYRPVAVQQFMVEHTFAEVAQGQTELTPDQAEAIWQQVYQIWALPSFDPLTPPPHSTGGAVDISLVDQAGQSVFMGSPIDELSVRSHPDYFAKIAADPIASELDRSQAQQANAHRQILSDVMLAAGFERHWGEWWHFCLGDQMWAWLRQQQGDDQAIARYGRADLLVEPEVQSNQV